MEEEEEPALLRCVKVFRSYKSNSIYDTMPDGKKACSYFLEGSEA